MDLPTRILHFFQWNTSSEQEYPKSFEEFTNQPDISDKIDVNEIFKTINILKTEGYLTSIGSKSGRNFYSHELYACLNYNQKTADYGTYNFIVHGFSLIASHFSKSVRPIIITKKDGSLDIGTGFLLGNIHTLFTAKHVIEDAELIQIPDSEGKYVEVVNVIYPEDENLDIAIVLIDKHAFLDVSAFKLTEATNLEDIMTIGYPPIPGFDAIQIYEKASVNNSFKFSKGQIIGNGKSYFDDTEYILINAKVKGGNSGSPVINKKGNVIGMVVKIPTDSENAEKLDSLGYGIVTPRNEMRKLLKHENYTPENIIKKVENTGNGFKILK